MNKVGDRFFYYTWDERKMPDGLYHVGTGGQWGWKIGKGFKTVTGARKWCIKQAGTDKYKE